MADIAYSITLSRRGGLILSAGVRMFSVPAQAASTTMISPGITRRANERPPLMPAIIILLIVFVESPGKIGKTASVALIFSDATSEATRCGRSRAIRALTRQVMQQAAPQPMSPCSNSHRHCRTSLFRQRSRRRAVSLPATRSRSPVLA